MEKTKSENSIMTYLDEIWDNEYSDDVCKLCGSPNRDLASDHLRFCYKISQDELDSSSFKPRYIPQEDMNKLERGFNSICGNRHNCEKRQRENLKQLKAHA